MEDSEYGVEDSEYRQALKHYPLDTLRDVERHINRDLYPERWEWLQAEIERRLAGVLPLAAAEPADWTEEQETYAGFLRRVAATGVDTLLIFLPLSLCFRWCLTLAHPFDIATVALFPLLFPLYNLICLGRWGQTVGKRAAGIRVVVADGGDLPAKTALLRHLPDVALALGMVIALAAGVPEYLAAARGHGGDVARFHRLVPLWDRLDDLWDLWIWSECVVLLFNPTRRGLHDYLGGTWVITANRLDRFLDEPPPPFSWRTWARTGRERLLRAAGAGARGHDASRG